MTTKEKADAILTKHYQETFSMRVALKHAIISTQNTIDVLLRNIDDAYFMGRTKQAIAEQEQILNELKSRL